MKYGLPFLIAVMGMLYIFVIPTEPFIVKLLFKLIPMWLILLYAYLRMPTKKTSIHWIIFIGLFFGMLGDGLLVWFVIGLTAFLIGHLFYMTGFFRSWQYSRFRFYSFIPLALFAAFMSWRMIEALNMSGNEALIIPVLLYIFVISLMAWSAIMTGQLWLIIGSILFMISDSILAWNMFVTDVAFSSQIIMITYYSAQFCIAHNMKTITMSKDKASLSILN